MKRRKRVGRVAASIKQAQLNTTPHDDFFDTDEFDMDFSGASESTASAPVKRKSSFNIRDYLNLRGAILLLLIVVIAVCAVILFGRWFDYKRSDELYNALSADMFKEVSNDPSVLSASPLFDPQPSVNNYDQILNSGVTLGQVAPSKEISIEHARVKAKLEEIKRINDDIMGWIRIEGTQINYPVVIGSDNDYYLTHAYNGEYLRSGTIFADYLNLSRPTNNRNLVLYGHNMANGSMFAGVKKFLKEDFFNEHKKIVIYTFDGMYEYEIYAILDTDTYVLYNQMYFATHEEYEEFLHKMKGLSLYESDVELSASDKILTLSTCNNSRSTGRYALIAKLVKTEEAK